MATFLVDTSVLVDALNGRNGRPVLLERLIEQGHSLACCAVNVAEVYAGMRPKEERVTRALLESLSFLDLTWEVARRAGEIRREWGSRGRTLSVADCLIASAAMAHDAILITDNVKDFPMKDLKLHAS